MEEEQEVQQLIQEVVHSSGRDVEKHFCRYKAILTKYQEQPQLIDGQLEGIVQPLANLLRQAAMCSTAQDTAVVQGVCRMLHVLITVRGYKTVVRFFPHEAADLERVLQVLGYITDQAACSSPGAGSGYWEAQAVLLLWLSILILIPFDLVILDSSVTEDSSRATVQNGYPPLAAKVMSLCQSFLPLPGAVREMAALLLARLLTRPDMTAALAAFISWQQQALEAAAGPQAVFLLPGILQTLAQVYKLGRREELLRWAPVVWQQLSALLADDAVSGLASNALARKLAVKLAQRVGLIMLPPQVAGWRYVQVAEDMAANLTVADAAATAAAVAVGGEAGAAGRTAVEAGAVLPDTAAAAEAAVCADVELPDIPAEIEDVLGVLLASCSDRDTVVRWSAAKGVGRLAACLPPELSEEVVQGVLVLLSPAEPDTAWHGACLAVAELARRSILSPSLLGQVAQLLSAALTYDVRRGPHSVGAHVRDAAAYVCWALARSYLPSQLTDCVHALAASLLVVTCYDREVNCRRAAAAAFQECVGRLGSFPHGLQILAVADYFSVGNMASAYLRVAPFVAQFPEYTQALLDHLLLVKLHHWDKPVRALAAMGLAVLAPVAPTQLAEQALPQLLQLVTHDTLEVRCGAVLGIAELLPALAAAQQQLAGSVGLDVVQVLQQLEAASCYKGRGGEVMREMAARLVQQVAAASAGLQADPLYGSSSSSRRHRAEQELEQHSQQQQQQPPQQDSRVESPAAAGASDGSDDGDVDDEPGQGEAAADTHQTRQQQQALALPLTPEFHAAAERLLLDCLSHVQDSIQAAGIAALRTYACAFQQEQQEALLLLVSRCCRRLTEREVAAAARRGAAAALGVLPRGLVGIRAEEVLQVLVSAVQAPLDPVAGFSIETRIAAVNALAQLTQELMSQQPVQQLSSQGLQCACAAAAPASDAAAAAQPCIPLPVLQHQVLPALLAELGDYSRDNRGDIGSWVREAAMDGTTQLWLQLTQMLPAAPEQPQHWRSPGKQQHAQQQQQQQQPLQAIPPPQHHHHQQQGPDSSAAVDQGRWSAAAVAAVHSSLSVQLVGGLLQQSVERIARLREAALINLQTIMQQPCASAVVPGASMIAAALPGNAAELAGVASLACVGRVGALLQLQWYRAALLEGLVASIGGVDASLAKEASAALLVQVGPAAGADQELRASVALLLLQLWQQESGSARLSLPLIKTAALLISHADFAAVPVSAAASQACRTDSSSGSGDTKSCAAYGKAPAAAAAAAAAGTSGPCSFAQGVLQQLKLELKGCGDVAKLLEGAALLAQLSCLPDCSASAIQTVMVLLVNRYPKVRRAMAEQLYLQMLAVQSEAEDVDGLGSECSLAVDGFSTFQQLTPADLEAAQDVLLTSVWDGPLEQVRVSREELAVALHVEIKTRRVARGLTGRSAGAVQAGEQESYQTLLDDAARGGGY